MALLTKSKESTLTETENSVLTSSIFQGLAENLGLCACVLHVTRHSSLTQMAQKFDACKIGGEWVTVSMDFGSRAMKLGSFIYVNEGWFTLYAKL